MYTVKVSLVKRMVFHQANEQRKSWQISQRGEKPQIQHGRIIVGGEPSSFSVGDSTTDQLECFADYIPRSLSHDIHMIFWSDPRNATSKQKSRNLPTSLIQFCKTIVFITYVMRTHFNITRFMVH